MLGTIGDLLSRTTGSDSDAGSPSGEATCGWRWYRVQSPSGTESMTERHPINMINPKTGYRIRMMTVDAETDEELQRRDLVKGYEFQKERYLLLSDQDFDSVKVESSSVMNIGEFIEVDSTHRSATRAAITWHLMVRPGAMSMQCSTKPSRRLVASPWHRVVASVAHFRTSGTDLDAVLPEFPKAMELTGCRGRLNVWS